MNATMIDSLLKIFVAVGRKRSATVLGIVTCLAVAVPRCASGESAILVERVASGLSRPIYATTAPGDASRMFVVEQHRGAIKIVDPNTGTLQDDPFLRIGGLATGNEQGLLGLAFDPNYATNGYFYVNLTVSDGTTEIRRYQVSDDPNVADPASRTTLLSYDQPQGNHNGGWMGFDPTRSEPYLYIASGDGGAGNDTGSGHTARIGNGQDLTDNLLGKMLRIDVSRDDFPDDNERNYGIPASNPFVGVEGDDEIWSYGLRNPWRASFDRATGDLYMGDVGQGQREEVNFQPAGDPGGANYGWRLREGFIQTPGVGGPEPADYVPPIHDYRHTGAPDGGSSITGGYVYRGPIESLNGRYFFGDFVSSQVWSLRHDGTTATDVVNHSDSLIPDAGSVEAIASFAEDQAGNLYVLSLNGDMFRINQAVELEELFSAGSDWSYLDDGSDQGRAWLAVDFDDSQWARGPAKLGYGEGDEATVVSFGPDSRRKHVTTYFRTEFELGTETDQLEQVLLGLRYDDAAAVYLNGVEVVRTEHLPDDATFDTLAERGRGGTDEDVFQRYSIDPSHFVDGTNLLAVEVHQSSLSSSDMGFDLKIDAVFVPEPTSLGWLTIITVGSALRRRRLARQ